MRSSFVRAFSLLFGLAVGASASPASTQDTTEKVLTVEQRAQLAERLSTRLRTEVTSFEPGWELSESKEPNALLQWRKGKTTLTVRFSVYETKSAAAQGMNAKLDVARKMTNFKGRPLGIGDEGFYFGPSGGTPTFFRGGNFEIYIGAPSETVAKRVAEIVHREIQALPSEP